MDDSRRSYSVNADEAACTRCNFAEATIFIAEVILSVLRTEAMRALISLSAAIGLRFQVGDGTFGRRFDGCTRLVVDETFA